MNASSALGMMLHKDLDFASLSFHVFKILNVNIHVSPQEALYSQHVALLFCSPSLDTIEPDTKQTLKYHRINDPKCDSASMTTIHSNSFPHCLSDKGRHEETKIPGVIVW